MCNYRCPVCQADMIKLTDNEHECEECDTFLIVDLVVEAEQEAENE